MSPTSGIVLGAGAGTVGGSKVKVYVVSVIVDAVIANPEFDVGIAYKPGVPFGIKRG
jgi:hypothetical protein